MKYTLLPDYSGGAGIMAAAVLPTKKEKKEHMHGSREVVSW